MSARDAASERQIRAADPAASTWLAANAGSGKTRVLTDRVARLLLEGVLPQNILCLTYTKAAASEMQNRLFRRLGEWAMLDDDVLRAELARLGAEGAEGPSGGLAAARRLFAAAIETPGGLKIQTIHSFCAAVLRRFPMEAGISPGFRELDDRAARELQREVLDDLALAEPALFSEMAALIGDEDLTGLCAEIMARRAEWPPRPDPAHLAALHGLAPGATPDSLRADLAAAVDEPGVRDCVPILRGLTKTMIALADALALLLEQGMTDALRDTLTRLLLYAGDQTPKPAMLTKGARTALGPLTEVIEDLAAALARFHHDLRALENLRRTLVLHRFAAAWLPRIDARKAALGVLDFDDLINLTESLLSRPEVADWVLYRLDGGIDHVLVDEAQDTSPRQWRVLEHLTREFTAGEGATPDARTLFVVGDMKQSIYSFQGAAPEEFLRMRDRFAARLAQVNRPLVRLELEYSFRSAPAILRAVDQVFHPENRAGMGENVQHLAFRAALPGRVDLWPVVEPAGTGDETDWFDPVDRVAESHHTARLAAAVADAAAQMVQTGVLHAPDGTPRPVTAGDILILVQRRSDLFHELIRACTLRGLDVAGADVLKLTEELAVKDLMALLSFLATPEDDLSLAAALRSPLLGWSEGALFRLATGRAEGEFLWAALRRVREVYPDTLRCLDDLRRAADFLRPYDLLERVLIRHDGRRRLLARLGEEANEAIDALLSQALAQEREGVPSLTAFLARLEGQAFRVKRRPEGRGTRLRVMTVHGAKGLEAPIVFLPDCGVQQKLGRLEDAAFAGPDGTPLWNGARDALPEALHPARQAALDRRREESQRLLYVAMTRAEQWLIVAAAGDPQRLDETWYGQMRAGLDRAGAQVQGFADGPGLRLETGDWSAARPPLAAPVVAGPAALPDWAQGPPPPPARPPLPVAPSDLGGAKALPGDAGDLAETALARGTAVHLLLEHLPRHPPADWDRVAQALLPGSDPAAPLSEARAVLDAPHLRAIFAPGTLAEVELTAPLPGLGRLQGTLDRLIVAPDHVLAVDFKTNRTLPERPEEVPEGILRQMGAYEAALRAIWPDRRIETAILWTCGARLMALPPGLAAAALARAGAA